jgi:hypothetical protein
MVKPILLVYEERLYTAEISEIFHPMHWMFHVHFNDGYENIFFSDVETGKWVEQDLGFTPLAELVGKKIESHIPKDNVVRKSLNWYHEEYGGRSINFGYHLFIVDGFYTYEIFAANKRYMFTLVKVNNELWQLFKVPGMAGWNYNEDYIEEIPFIIDTLEF